MVGCAAVRVAAWCTLHEALLLANTSQHSRWVCGRTQADPLPHAHPHPQQPLSLLLPRLRYVGRKSWPQLLIMCASSTAASSSAPAAYAPRRQRIKPSVASSSGVTYSSCVRSRVSEAGMKRSAPKKAAEQTGGLELAVHPPNKAWRLPAAQPEQQRPALCSSHPAHLRLWGALLQVCQHLPAVGLGSGGG